MTNIIIMNAIVINVFNWLIIYYKILILTPHILEFKNTSSLIKIISNESAFSYNQLSDQFKNIFYS